MAAALIRYCAMRTSGDDAYSLHVVLAAPSRSSATRYAIQFWNSTKWPRLFAATSQLSFEDGSLEGMAVVPAKGCDGLVVRASAIDASGRRCGPWSPEIHVTAPVLRAALLVHAANGSGGGGGGNLWVRLELTHVRSSSPPTPSSSPPSDRPPTSSQGAVEDGTVTYAVANAATHDAQSPPPSKQPEEPPPPPSPTPNGLMPAPAAAASNALVIAAPVALPVAALARAMSDALAAIPRSIGTGMQRVGSSVALGVSEVITSTTSATIDSALALSAYATSVGGREDLLLEQFEMRKHAPRGAPPKPALAPHCAACVESGLRATDAAFGLTRHRHHCAHCGGSFCAAHLRWRQRLDHKCAAAGGHRRAAAAAAATEAAARHRTSSRAVARRSASAGAACCGARHTRM